MDHGLPSSPPHARPIVWWILWFAILSGIVIFQFILKTSDTPRPESSLRYLPLLPLAIGTCVRWVILPPLFGKPQALPVFLIGLALSEACAILGIFLVPEMRQTYVILGFIGVFQFLPYFAARKA